MSFAALASVSTSLRNLLVKAEVATVEAGIEEIKVELLDFLHKHCTTGASLCCKRIKDDVNFSYEFYIRFRNGDLDSQGLEFDETPESVDSARCTMKDESVEQELLATLTHSLWEMNDELGSWCEANKPDRNGERLMFEVG